MVSSAEREEYEKLVLMVRMLVQHDAALREKYAVGDRFRFVRERLHAIPAEVEIHRPALSAEGAVAERKMLSAETFQQVYIYHYNAQGALLRSWVPLLTQRAFYDHSINRPVYLDREAVETVLRGKSNPVQHAFLIIAVPESEIVRPAESAAGSVQQPRVKEGALRIERMVSLMHNGQEYVLNVQGELVKKI